METPGIDSMAGLFDSLTKNRLDRLLKEIDERDNEVPENDDGYPDI
jgi:Mg/Co/Ni transporter MgtE